MKNIIKTSFYTSVGLFLLGLSNVNAAINADPSKVQSGIVTEWSAADVIQRWLTNLLTFLYLAAVLYAIWGWFNILTAAGDEEKVKKWKTVLIHAMAWIVVIFLAGAIINWLITAILV